MSLADAPEIRFFVAGKPVPGGSKRAIPRQGKDGRLHVSVIDTAKGNADWKSHVANTAGQHYRGDPLAGPLDVTLLFTMPRPKGHYRTGKHAHLLRPDAPYYHTIAPDVLKLARSTEDAMKGVIYRDDSLTVRLLAVKVYGTRPGVEVIVKPVKED